jgi:TM2 domain family protein
MDGSFLLMLKGKVPDMSLIVIRDRMQKLEAKGIKSDISPTLARLKSPVTGLFIGYVGADRFYKGDKNLAINKLSYFIVAIAFTIPGIYHNSESEITFSFILYLIVSIWCLADILPVFFGIKRDNFDKIMQALDNYENKDVNLTQKG